MRQVSYEEEEVGRTIRISIFFHFKCEQIKELQMKRTLSWSVASVPHTHLSSKAERTPPSVG